jgi:hypothetical protein
MHVAPALERRQRRLRLRRQQALDQAVAERYPQFARQMPRNELGLIEPTLAAARAMQRYRH